MLEVGCVQDVANLRRTRRPLTIAIRQLPHRCTNHVGSDGQNWTGCLTKNLFCDGSHNESSQTSSAMRSGNDEVDLLLANQVRNDPRKFAITNVGAVRVVLEPSRKQLHHIMYSTS